MKIKNGTVILVADGAKLRLFRNDGDTILPALATLSQEDVTNPPTREHGTDTPGRTYSSAGTRRSSYDETDRHTQAEQGFARHAAELLERTAAAQPDAGIVVVAAPRTLGELRRHYGRETGRRLLCEIGKDLANHTTDGIVDVIAAHTP